MMKPLSLFTRVAPAILLSSWASAQVQIPGDGRGPLSVVGSILSLDDPASEETYVKAPIDQSAFPTAWALTSGPDFSLGALFPDHVGSVEIDAMSSGNAYIPPLVGGEPDLSFNWAAITISVTNDAVGLPNNGWIEHRLSGEYPGRTTPGADLATHYFDTDAVGVLSQNLVGNSFLTQLAEHQGLGGMADHDVDALDIAMGVIADGGGLVTRLFFKQTDYFYFSVSPESAMDLSNQSQHSESFAVITVNGFPQDEWHIDPAAIYQCVWDDNAQEWSKPEAFLTRADLGLLPSPAEENVDAIDVSLWDGFTRAVFSTQPKIGRSQLQYVTNDSGIYVASDLRTENDLATKQFLLEEKTGEDDQDDVDAICFFDPEPYEYDDRVGIAVPSPGNNLISLSTMLLDNEYVFQITGDLTPPGSGSTPTFFTHLTVEYSLRYNPNNPTAPAGWRELVDGWSTGSTTELYSSLTLRPSFDDRDIFFRVRARATETSTPFAKSWVCGMCIEGI